MNLEKINTKNPRKTKALLTKVGFLAGLSKSVVDRINEAYISGDLGYGIPIPRPTYPDGESREGLHSEWMFKLIEASFKVEDELEHTQKSADRKVVNELRYRRNVILDHLGENERADMAFSRCKSGAKVLLEAVDD